MPNRLANETSPYLLQHAENPVDWYPWGEAALEKAASEDRPIFLSIGYSACHWCHVMEHESFEDSAIAEFLNEHFVSIKVDREERPDLDQIYMNAVMALRGGGGGWPLSVFLTPTREVFFGGTYWPPLPRQGMPGFLQVLQSVLDAYQNRRDQVDEQSGRITAWLQGDDADAGEDAPLSLSFCGRAVAALQQGFDPQQGGFGGAPKFPHPMDLQFLIRMASDPPPETAIPATPEVLLSMVRLSLTKMAQGGIFDHLAGGFARYTVDAAWQVPHFEKMLYDNALLTSTYLEMFTRTGDPFDGQVARQVLDYLLAEMQHPAGGFFSTEDADSEGEEGKFYVWDKAEILDVLGESLGGRFNDLYGVTTGGNFEGRNILHLDRSLSEFAAEQGQDLASLEEEMQVARQTLLAVRNQRVRPGRDDKVLVAWNGLTLSALGSAALRLGDERYLDAAEQCARFLRREMTYGAGRLWHTWRNGEARLNAYLDDYTSLINGLLALYHVRLDPEWLEWSCELMSSVCDYFEDTERGGFFYTSHDHEELIARTRSFQDGATPSGNGLAATALIRLGRLTGNPDWLASAERTLRAAAPLLERAPTAAGQMLLALELWGRPVREWVLATTDQEMIDRWLPALQERAIRGDSIAMVDPHREPPAPLRGVLAGKTAIGGQPTLYCCAGYQCESPRVGAEEIDAALAENSAG